MGRSRMRARMVPAAVCLCLLGLMAAVGGFDYRPIAGTDQYHSRVRRALDDVPYRIGEWVGRDVEPLPAAIELLKPNKILQRSYRSADRNLRVELLIVHCADLRDLAGHYPPICYPSNGWEPGGSAKTTISVGGEDQLAYSYRFFRSADGNRDGRDVLNFFIVPTGRSGIVADMKAVRRLGERRALAGLGAAQIQILTSDRISDKDRAGIRKEFTRALEAVIRTIASGPG